MAPLPQLIHNRIIVPEKTQCLCLVASVDYMEANDAEEVEEAMDAKEAYPALDRRKAYGAIRTKYPELFPTWLGGYIKRLLVDPGDAMQQSVNEYEHFVQFQLETGVSLEIAEQLAVHTNDDAFDALFTIYGPLQDAGSSWTKLEVRLGKTNDDLFAELADDSSQIVVKMQYTPSDLYINFEAENKSREFLHEVVASFIFNAFVTGFEYTATPHFTTFLGCFRQPRESDDDTRLRMAAAYERGKQTVANLLWFKLQDANSFELDSIGSIMFAVVSAQAIAAQSAGAAHNDLHLHNIMTRLIWASKYENKTWAYKLQGRHDYILIPFSVHKNTFTEIIDLGRATFTRIEPGSTVDCPIGIRFVQDMQRFLSAVLANLEAKTTSADVKKLDKVITFVSRLRQVVGVLTRIGKQEKDAIGLAAGNDFLKRWHDPAHEASLAFLIDMVQAGHRPITEEVVVVSIAPADTLRVVDDPMARALSEIWGSVPQGVKRTAYETCMSCGSRAHFTSEERTYAFCGQDCQKVFYGVWSS
jgi:hypothetical protein